MVGRFAADLLQPEDGFRCLSLQVQHLGDPDPGVEIPGLQSHGSIELVPGFRQVKAVEVGVAQHHDERHVLGRN